MMSDAYSTFQVPYQKPTPDKRLSGCAKMTLAVSALGVLFLVLICVAGSLFVRQSLTRQPEQVRQLGSQILDWDPPATLPPLAGMDVWIARFVFFGDPPRGLAMWGDSRFMNGDPLKEQMQDQIQADVGGKQFEETRTIEAGIRQFTIRGESTELTFNQTQGKTSGNRYWELLGVVPGRRHPVFLYLRLRQDEYTEQNIDAMIQSIR